MITISKNPRETKNLAKKFLKERLAAAGTKNFSFPDSASLLVCLKGDLGGGKTTFVQGAAEALGIKELVTSPTFLIMKKYQTPRKKARTSFKSLYHFDCYRVESAQEILDLGWEEIIKEKNNIILVEWAEKIKEILPKESVWIKFEFVNENKREIKIIG